jgi:hypothetical protein
MNKDPDKRFQSAHEFRKALLKVGMVHVRAYRRLKAIRREKDKAALSLSPTWRREEEEVLSFTEQLTARLEGFYGKFFGRKKAALTAVVAGIAVLGLATTLLMRPEKELSASVAQSTVPNPEIVLPGSPSTIPDPVTTPAATALAIPASTAIPAKTPDNGDTTVAKNSPAPNAAPAKTELSGKKPASRPRQHQNSVKTDQAKKPDGQKYDDLKKAWGG